MAGSTNENLNGPYATEAFAALGMDRQTLEDAVLLRFYGNGVDVEVRIQDPETLLHVAAQVSDCVRLMLQNKRHEDT